MSELLTRAQAKRLWLRALRLDRPDTFGAGPAATTAAVQHLGYVQIDTIHVIERSHHHILFTRIPRYKRADLQQAQSKDKTVFEYWTHALSYVPTRDFRFFAPAMKRSQKTPMSWFKTVKPADLRKVLRLVKRQGALSIRDIDDDVLVEKDHPWASRKPSKRALQLAFFNGLLTVSERQGMLKAYDLTDRHFEWDQRPKPASEPEVLAYLLERALRAQAVVSVDSICHLDAKRKAGIKKLIESKMRKKELVAVTIRGAENVQHWAQPELLASAPRQEHDVTHLLSPFDPLVIMRKRVQLLFEYEHRFEAYLPKERRVFGYFALPVLVDDDIVALVDLKTDRERRQLLVQRWTWVKRGKSAANKRRIEDELHRFERFQLDV